MQMLYESVARIAQSFHETEAHVRVVNDKPQCVTADSMLS
jgi:hypothetical protein